eukprot:tig00000144_g9107.t1
MVQTADGAGPRKRRRWSTGGGSSGSSSASSGCTSVSALSPLLLSDAAGSDEEEAEAVEAAREEAAKPIVRSALQALDLEADLERLSLNDAASEGAAEPEVTPEAVNGAPGQPAPAGLDLRASLEGLLAPAAPPKPVAAALVVAQAAAPPYRLEGASADALLAWAQSAADSLRHSLGRAPGAAPLHPGPSLREQQSRLARALADARLLNLPLFRTLRGRSELRSHLALLRASGLVGASLVPAVFRALADALLAPLPVRADAWRDPAAAAGSCWAEEDADVLLEHCWALVRAGTTDTPRACPELFALDWATAERLALRADELSLPFERAPGALRAKALCFRAFLLDTWKRDEEAVPAYFVAWSELRRRQLAPSPLEAALVPRLAQLLFEAFSAPTALAVRESAYRLAGTEEEGVLAQLEEIRMQMSTATWRGEPAGAVAAAARGVALLEGLEGAGRGEFGLLRARMQLDLGLTQLLQGSPLAFAATWVRAAEALVAACREDPGAPELDVIPFFHYARSAQSKARRLRAVRVSVAVLERADKEERTPLHAHAYYRMGCAYLQDGQPRQAEKFLRRALALYSTRFGHIFAGNHPRMEELERALEWISGQPGPARRPFLSFFSRKPRRVSDASAASSSGCSSAAASAPQLKSEPITPD